MSDFSFPLTDSTDRSVDWSALSPEDLIAYASQWEDMLTGAQPDELDWVYIPELPVAALWLQGDAEAWWADQEREAAENGMPGLWDGLLEDGLLDNALEQPIVAGFYGRQSGEDSFSFWDGNHRCAASVLIGRPAVPAVIGIGKGLDLSDLPEAIQTVVAERLAEMVVTGMGPAFG